MQNKPLLITQSLFFIIAGCWVESNELKIIGILLWIIATS